jgi:hypothetical protein
MQLTSGFVRDKDKATTQEVMEDTNKAQVLAMVTNKQARHTPYVARIVYAHKIMEWSRAVADQRQQFRTSSVEWHQFLGFILAMDLEETRSQKHKWAPFKEEAKSRWME